MEKKGKNNKTGGEALQRFKKNSQKQVGEVLE